MEKYAIISDIHSNIYALKAVVEDARSKGATAFINLGDILYGPIAPKETYDFLTTLNAITVSGNQDRQIYQATPSEIRSNPTMKFILDDLGLEPLNWMKQLPFDHQVTDDIYACHGTPKDDLIYLLENIESGSAQLRDDNEIVNLLNGVTSPIVLCGHTHTPRCVELSTGQIIINPGSVGLQAYQDDEPIIHKMENFTPRASYVLLEKLANGEWSISFHRVNYDIAAASSKAKLRNRADWVEYLETGRCSSLAF